MIDDDFPELLSVGEVAKLFRVDPRTVNRWARQGKLTHVRTLGGHRRYLGSAIRELLAEMERESRQSES